MGEVLFAGATWGESYALERVLVFGAFLGTGLLALLPALIAAPANGRRRNWFSPRP